MKYETAAVFRTALETRLRQHALDTNVSLVRLRKMVVFDRFLARLNIVAADQWMVKGGVALDLRLGSRARMTKDLDLAAQYERDAMDEAMLALQSMMAHDFFTFATQRITTSASVNEAGTDRYRVLADLDGRRFEEVVVDVGYHDPVVAPPDRLPGPDLLGFAGIPRIEVPALALEQHLAEKVHAYTRTYAQGHASTRVKDLADLILIGSIAEFTMVRLRRTIWAVFDDRHTHACPVGLPPPPANWRTSWRHVAGQVDLEPDLIRAFGRAAALLDPALGNEPDGERIWDPLTWSWRRTLKR
jgi:hypothetical protein